MRTPIPIYKALHFAQRGKFDAAKQQLNAGAKIQMDGAEDVFGRAAVGSRPRLSVSGETEFFLWLMGEENSDINIGPAFKYLVSCWPDPIWTQLLLDGDLDRHLFAGDGGQASIERQRHNRKLIISALLDAALQGYLKSPSLLINSIQHPILAEESLARPDFYTLGGEEESLLEELNKIGPYGGSSDFQTMVQKDPLVFLSWFLRKIFFAFFPFNMAEGHRFRLLEKQHPGYLRAAQQAIGFLLENATEEEIWDWHLFANQGHPNEENWLEEVRAEIISILG